MIGTHRNKEITVMALTMVKPEEMENQAGTKLSPGEWFEID